VGGLEGRLTKIEARIKPVPSSSPEARARIRAFLEELAAAKREGRALSAEAESISQAMQRRRQRES
jgi:hypothetical protein